MKHITKKSIAIISAIAFIAMSIPAFSQGPGNPNPDDTTYPNRDHEYVWGSGEEVCLRQCVLVSNFECLYIDGSEENC